MKAMILAAGRGKRMGKLTENRPKPLLKVGAKTLIEWQIKRLQDNGFEELVINVGYLGEQIRQYLGDGSRYGVKIAYSVEPQAGLETGGGVLQALPLLGDAPFLLTNADVFCDYPYWQLADKNPEYLHAVLVNNPAFKEKGDFAIKKRRLQRGQDYTFAGISVLSPRLFAGCQAGYFPIAPLFHHAIDNNRAGAEIFTGMWHDVGTAERLQQVEAIYNR